MPKRKRQPKCRVIRLYKNRTPEIMPWLDKQTNQTMSVYMLIRMAQQLFGNKDWPNVSQNLANPSIIKKILGVKSDSELHMKLNVNKENTSHSGHKRHDHGDSTVNQSSTFNLEDNGQPSKVGHMKKGQKSKKNEDQSDNSISNSDLKSLLNG